MDTLKSRGGPFTDSDQQCKVVEDEAGSSVCQRKYHTSARRRSYLPNPDDTAVQCEEEDENSTAGVWGGGLFSRYSTELLLVSKVLYL